MIKFLYIYVMKDTKKYKRGDKHPTDKNLIFWQYHHPYFKETNGECWLTFDEFEERREKHKLSTRKYKRKNPLMYIVSGAMQRDKQKYQTLEDKIIDLKFIENLLKIQNNKGYSKDNVVITCYAANCGRGVCSTEIWLKIIKNIKNGLNKNS